MAAKPAKKTAQSTKLAAPAKRLSKSELIAALVERAKDSNLTKKQAAAPESLPAE
jgi:hypothetical protein